MNFSFTNSFVSNSSINKKSKTASFTAMRKKTVYTTNLNRSTLNQTAKVRSKYKKILQLNKELVIENANLKVENRSITQENNLLRQRQVFGVVPSKKMKPLLDKASTNLMSAVDNLCEALALCNQNPSDVTDETDHGIAPVVEQELITNELKINFIPNVEEPKQKKFNGQPKQQKDVRFNLFEPIDERHFSEYLLDMSDISDLPDLLFVDQDKAVAGKENKKPTNKITGTEPSTSSKLDNASLKCNLYRTSMDLDTEAEEERQISICKSPDQAESNLASVSTSVIQETSESCKTSVETKFDKIKNRNNAIPSFFPFPSSARSVNKPIKVVANSNSIIHPLQDAENERKVIVEGESKKFAITTLGEEIPLAPSEPNENIFQNETNNSACDMELTEVWNFAPIVENSLIISPNAAQTKIDTDNEKTAQNLVQDVSKRNLKKMQSSPESDKNIDPDFVPAGGKKSKRQKKVNKNFSFFDTKIKKVAPKTKTTRKSNKAKVKDRGTEMEAQVRDIFDLSSSFNKTSSFIKPYSPRPKHNLSNAANTSARRLSGVEIDSDESKIAVPQTKSVKSRVYRRKTGTVKQTTKPTTTDSNSDEENGKTPNTVVKKKMVKTKTAKKTVLANTNESSNNIEHSDKSPSVTPFVSKEAMDKAKKKLKLTLTKRKSRAKMPNEENDSSETGATSTASRESIQYDPLVPKNMRTSNVDMPVEAYDEISASGRPRRGPPKSYKGVPLNKKLRRNN